jgi:hypothetical protein
VSDEIVALDRGTGTVAPYPKPLGLEGERLVPASSLGRVAGRPVTPNAIVFPRYEAGAEVSDVPLDPGWSLVALAAHATNVAALGRTALTWLAGLALACPARLLTYGDAPRLVAVIERAADAPGRPAEPAEVLPPVTDDTTTVALGNSLAVLHEPSGKVHLLNAGASAMWCRAAALEACDRSSLMEAVLGADDCDRPGRSTAAATIDRLVRSGLLPAPTGP